MRFVQAFLKLDHVGRICSLLLGATLLAIACSDSDDTPRKKPENTDNPYTSYSLKIFSGKGDARKRVDIPPLKEASFHIPREKLNPRTTSSSNSPFFGAPASTGAPDKKEPSSKAQTVIITPEGGVTTDSDLGTTLGWALVYGAAYECGFGSNRSYEHYPIGQDPVITPWSGGSYFIFFNPPEACDEQLAYQEAMLCISDKLAEVADTPARLTWSKVPAEPTTTGMPPGPWEIPPQASKDRFIARDLAIHILAILGYTDLLTYDSPPGATNPTRTCARAYGEAAALTGTTPGSGVLDNYYDTVFGGPEDSLPIYLPPTDERIRLENFALLGKARLLFNAHVIRGAARLLKEQLPKAIYADLAGGEQQRAKATDPVRGAKLLWGAETDSDEAYNSLSHVARVMAGRWERGELEQDPPCGGIEPMNLLKDALGPEFSARYSDQVVNTTDQMVAAKLVDAAGIVIPQATVLGGEPFGDVRSAVVDQLVANAATVHGVSPADTDFNDWGEGKAIRTMMDQVSDEDLRFGLLKSFSVYRQLTSTPEDAAPTPSNPGGGLSATITVSSLSGIGGIAVNSFVREQPLSPTSSTLVPTPGLPRGDLAVSIAARIGGLQTANQCTEPDDMESSILADGGKLSAFQDVFYIGETFKKRLIAIREEAKLVFDETDDVVTVPAKAAAEVRTWAGEGRLTLNTSEVSGEVDRFTLGLIGFNPEDFGVESAADISDQIVLVYGPPWVADCAARLRTSCPDDFDDEGDGYMARPDTTTVLTDADPSDPPYSFDRSWSRMTGADGVTLMLTFDPGSWPTKFQPQIIGTTNPTSKLYVVARNAPGGASAKGRVLGALAPRGDGITTVIAGKHGGKLFDDIFGVGGKGGGNAGGGGGGYLTFPKDDTTGTPPAYCIEGLTRKPFVPLENELTSDADPYENSWRHYLDLAKQASIRADELGREIIEFGLQKDLRSEAAGEELAQVCGDYTALDNIQVDEETGKIAKSPEDGALNTCLNEERVDVVFLTTVPPELVQAADKAAWIRTNVLACNDPVQIDDNPLCNQSDITYAGLGITDYVDPMVATEAECTSAVELPGTLDGPGFSSSKLQKIALADWVSDAGFLSTLQQAQLQIREDGNWGLVVGGARVMDTETTYGPLWPSCVPSTGTDKCDHTAPGGQATSLAVDFDRIFRWDSAVTSYSGSAAGKMMMLWRVEGALWLLGGLAGEVPAGLIQGYVPAARVDNLSLLTDPIPDSTVYGDGRWTQVSGDTYRLGIPATGVTITDSDIKEIGDVHPIDTDFQMQSAGAPDWVKDVYALKVYYFHVPAANARYSSREMTALFKSYAKLVAPPNTGPKVFLEDGQMGTWLSARAGELGGLFCFAPDQNPANPNPKYDRARNLISVAKLTDVSLNGIDQTFAGPAYAFGVASGPVSTYTQRLVPQNGTFFENLFDYSAAYPFQVNGIIPAYYYEAGGPSTAGQQSAASALRPTAIPPEKRMLGFVNSWLPTYDCTAASELAQALALGCMLSGNGLPFPTEAPPITSLGDLPKLEKWIGTMEQFTGTAVGRLYLQGVPMRVIKDFNSGSVGTGSLKGTHGELVLKLEAAIQAVAGGWPQLASQLAQLKSAVQYARLNVDMNKLEQHIASKNLMISQWQVHSKLAHSVANAVSGFGWGANGFNPLGGAAQSLAAAEDINLAFKELDALNEIQGLQDDLAKTKIDIVLNQLQETTSGLYGLIHTGISHLRETAAIAAATNEELRMSELSAQYLAAKGAGANFVEIDGEKVGYPVNAVLNRQYDVTKRRYEAALLEARYLAYVARIAIEQRLGMDLESFTDKIGPLEPPAQWADDVCSLAGVNYEELSDPFFGLDAGVTEQGAPIEVSDFSDMYIGDYVDRLEKFVEFYNMEYPSHDGDDIAVLSLRDDLLGPGGICTKQSPNYLLYSSDLIGKHYAFDQSSSSSSILVGWDRRPCTTLDDYCLELALPDTLDPPPDLPPGGAEGGITWLREVELSTVTDTGDLALISATTDPARIVQQSVHLDAGTYTLSWWDQARDEDGQIAASSIEYPVAIYDEQWTAVAADTFIPWDATGVNAWAAAPTTLTFSISTPGDYHVAFGAAVPGTDPGSVVIGNVQLEVGTTAALYWPNGSTRVAFDTTCSVGNTAAFQGAFSHVCLSGNDCSYVLDAPFDINPVNLNGGAHKLSGKIAANNFNYRHVTVGLNVVGSGVVDCALEPTAACYGSAYLEYTFDHSAFDVPVISHFKPKDAQHFNFGMGSINFGKALAAERFITLPIGSADSALLAQPAFEKNEFRGRPLEGTYRLKIKDKPSLKWSQVEDIQIILKYRYWSRILPQPSSG